MPTAIVLDHFRDELARIYGADNKIRIMLLAGADLIQTVSIILYNNVHFRGYVWYRDKVLLHPRR